MFTAVRTFTAAFVPALVLLPWAGALLCLPEAVAAGKPMDFGTSGASASSVAGSATFAGSFSTTTTIVNIPVCAALYDQTAPVLVADGGGGLTAVWSDFRSGSLDIYAQKLNSGGTPQWAADGVPACKATGHQTNPQAIPDGAGGVIVVWQDERSGAADIYAQRVSSLGTAMWTAGGVPVSVAANAQRNPVVVPNGLGGAIVAWVDERGADADVYVQQLNASGVPTWTANGVALCTATGVQEALSAISDGQGGGIVAWRDERGGADQADIYARRVNESGVPQWTANGVVACAAVGTQETPVATTDGMGGVIVTWADTRGATRDVYVQRLNGAGTAQWTADGVLLCGAAGSQQRPQLCSDGANGALVVWEDWRGAAADIYARRVNAAGAPQWVADGVGVCTATADQLTPSIAMDPAGGAVVVWSDVRTPANGQDIYLQHLQLDGTSLWTANGVLICDAANQQDTPTAVADGSGAAIALWRDGRSGSYTDVYAQRVDAFGQVPNQCTPPDSLLSNVPVSTVALQNHRTFRQTRFFWAGVGVRGAGGDWDIEVYDTGPTGVAPYPTCFGLPLAGSYGNSAVDFVVGNFNNNHTPPALYNTRVWRYSGTGGATLEWDDGPDQIAPDSLYTSPGGWTGPIDVFDIPLTAGIPYTVEITHDPGMDLRVLLFTSYGSPGYYYFAPRSERVFEMSGRYGPYTAVTTDYYGLVVTNENGGPGSYSLRVWSTTPVGRDDESTIAATGLRGLAPNPAPGRVQIEFAMQHAGEASFQIHDMAGRLVATIPVRRWQAGNWSVYWDGRGVSGRSLGAGVYFVQMKVDGRHVGAGRLALIP